MRHASGMSIAARIFLSRHPSPTGRGIPGNRRSYGHPDMPLSLTGAVIGQPSAGSRPTTCREFPCQCPPTARRAGPAARQWGGERGCHATPDNGGAKTRGGPPGARPPIRQQYVRTPVGRRAVRPDRAKCICTAEALRKMLHAILRPPTEAPRAPPPPRTASFWPSENRSLGRPPLRWDSDAHDRLQGTTPSSFGESFRRSPGIPTTHRGPLQTPVLPGQSQALQPGNSPMGGKLSPE